MEIKISTLNQNPAIKLIEFNGVLDLLASREVNRHLMPVIEEGSCFFVADLSRLEYINSSGIYCLMECFAKTQERGGYLKLFAASGRVAEILSLVGIAKVIPMYNSLEEALRVDSTES